MGIATSNGLPRVVHCSTKKGILSTCVCEKFVTHDPRFPEVQLLKPLNFTLMVENFLASCSCGVAWIPAHRLDTQSSP